MMKLPNFTRWLAGMENFEGSRNAPRRCGSVQSSMQIMLFYRGKNTLIVELCAVFSVRRHWDNALVYLISYHCDQCRFNFWPWFRLVIHVSCVRDHHNFDKNNKQKLSFLWLSYFVIADLHTFICISKHLIASRHGEDP
jgi:hypothetical protein